MRSGRMWALISARWKRFSNCAVYSRKSIKGKRCARFRGRHDHSNKLFFRLCSYNKQADEEEREGKQAYSNCPYIAQAMRGYLPACVAGVPVEAQRRKTLREFAAARARDETASRRLKQFFVLSHRFRKIHPFAHAAFMQLQI